MADLNRFVQAQAPVYPTVLAELNAGRKQTHWMWFVFPQLKALGRSAMAQHYGLQDAPEASAYWSHPVLGSRLAECVRAVLETSGRSALEIFGPVDALKFCSCMTLFEAAVGHECFGLALERFHGGHRDATTQALLAGTTHKAAPDSV